MSSHPDPHASHTDAEHHEPLDLDPVQTLPADEAPSPGWLPFAGAAVALLCATLWALGRATPAEQGAPPTLSSATAAAAKRPAPSTLPTRADAARKGRGDVPGRGRGVPDPDRAAELRRRLEERRAGRRPSPTAQP